MSGNVHDVGAGPAQAVLGTLTPPGGAVYGGLFTPDWWRATASLGWLPLKGVIMVLAESNNTDALLQAVAGGVPSGRLGRRALCAAVNGLPPGPATDALVRAWLAPRQSDPKWLTQVLVALVQDAAGRQRPAIRIVREAGADWEVVFDKVRGPRLLEREVGFTTSTIAPLLDALLPPRIAALPRIAGDEGDKQALPWPRRERSLLLALASKCTRQIDPGLEAAGRLILARCEPAALQLVATELREGVAARTLSVFAQQALVMMGAPLEPAMAAIQNTLVDMTGDPHSPKRTLLGYLIEQGDDHSAEVLHRLHQAGHDIDTHDGDGEGAPLLYMALMAHAWVNCAELLNLGADPTRRTTDPHGNARRSPLELALKIQQESQAEYAEPIAKVIAHMRAQQALRAAATALTGAPTTTRGAGLAR